MNLGAFIDTFKDAIARRVVESYPPLYRPSENGHKLPRLLRKPLGAQEDTIRGAALSLQAHRGTTVVGEMGTGKTFIAAAAAHMAGFRRVLVLCPPHLTRKWKREVEDDGALAPAPSSSGPSPTWSGCSILHRLRPPLRGDEPGEGQAVLPVDARQSSSGGQRPTAGWCGTRRRGNPSRMPCCPVCNDPDSGQGRRSPHLHPAEPEKAHLPPLQRLPSGRPTSQQPQKAIRWRTTSSTV